jgi:type IV pilus assembly protein PilB
MPSSHAGLASYFVPSMNPQAQPIVAADSGIPPGCFFYAVGPERLHSALPMNPRAVHFGAMEIDLRHVAFTPELLASIPAEFARRYRVLPINISPHEFLVALADPSDLEAIDSLHKLVQRDVALCVAYGSQLDEFIGRLYGDGAKS